MKIDFYKYQGTGNDFIMINGFGMENIDLSIDQIQHLCNRKLGIGSDGLIILRPSVSSDFYMDFYNPDGSQSFCGNGARCSVSFARHMGIVQSFVVFEAIDGVHKAELKDGLVKVNMSDVNSFEKIENDYLLDTGSPHYVKVVEESVDIVDLGRSIRYSERFKTEGVNVNTILFNTDNSINVQTYERGVEGETLSCGTGVTACSLIAMMKKGLNELDVLTKGGELKVVANYDGETFTDVWLIGPAKFVFSGTVEV